MKLIYCYIRRFRNIENQEVMLSDEYECHYEKAKLTIEKCGRDSLLDYVYDNAFMRNLRIIVGKTGSGKTNFLQLIGMDRWRRDETESDDSYLMLYKRDADDLFFVEEVGLGKGRRAYTMSYDFEKQEAVEVRKTDSNDFENTYIVNAFDRYAFSHCPYEDERHEGVEGNDEFVPRMIAQFGKTSVSMECDFLKEYIRHFSSNGIKSKASLVIRKDNWQYRHQFELDERLVKNEYWTYKDRAEELRKKNIRKGKYNEPIKYDKGSTPKSRFLHDLMTDFAIYLRKWAECVDEEFPEKYYGWSGYIYDLGIRTPDRLPDGKKMSILKRIDWLCQYLDYHTDEMCANKGLIWQIGSDIKDLFHLLGKMDDKYFSENEFSIPVIDIDLSEKSTMSEIFERMEQYRPDQIGVFTECLLPYHFSYLSSGEYQYAKIWGILEEYGLKVKMLAQGEDFSNAKQPNIILLLDEPENYMHPEMCRMFVSQLNRLLSSRDVNSEFQVLLSTHSPFMLSDVLTNQIIKMNYDESGRCLISRSEVPYFAANIHSIIADGFFLDYSIGEQARLFLTKKLETFRNMFDKQELSGSDKQDIAQMSRLLPNIGDDLIRHSFEMIIGRLQ